jgi:hypothetical protein
LFSLSGSEGSMLRVAARFQVGQQIEYLVATERIQ